MPGWKCDICGTERRHEHEEKPYECKKCHYDLCQSCMRGNESYVMNMHIMTLKNAKLLQQYVIFNISTSKRRKD